MTAQELSNILDLHKKYLREEIGGVRADLEGANLRGANLEGADLQGANLEGANLWCANLEGADLQGANLEGANLEGANLWRANLRFANLENADLENANLRGANLEGANLPKKLPSFFVCPDSGSFVGWKKLKGGVIARLKIPKEAKRTSSLVGRKCRAEFVIVKELVGLAEGELFALDRHSSKLEYRVGSTVYPDSYNDDIRLECVNGIHFFITKQEAEDYQ